MKLIVLFFVILLSFSYEDIPQTNLTFTKELIDDIENEYGEINKNKENLTSEIQTLLKFIAWDTYSNPYISTHHSNGQGCNKLVQWTVFFCGVHSVKQVLFKFGITKYNEYKLAKYAETITFRTSHEEIEQDFKIVNKREGTNFRIE